MNIEKIIKEAIENTMFDNKIKESNSNSINSDNLIKESYVTEAGKFNLSTELLSDKTKKSHQELLEGYVKKLNEISANLDTADTSLANLNNSEFRSLKIDETYNLNAAFLHGLYFQNISDLSSQISTDNICYMKLARDFGSFDKWQQDFVACALSARNGWAITLYSTQLKRYINTIIDLHSQNVMIGMQPVIVLDCWEHSYYRDTYVFAMMKELNWKVIEERFKQTEKFQKVLGK